MIEQEQACKELWSAVLWAAFEDATAAIKPREKIRSRRAALVDEAIREKKTGVNYILNREGTFDLACDVLGLDPALVSRRMAKKVKKALAHE